METIDKEKQEPVDTAEAAETADTAPDTEAAEGTEKSTDSAEPQEELTAEQKLQKQLGELNDRYMRMAAEYDNFRKRAAKERDQIRSDATGRTLSAMLPVYDNLERALAQETADADYKKGVEMIARQFDSALETMGVEIISAEAGTDFDPTVHNAVMHVEDDSLGENTIAECFQKGFRHGDRVIRTAMVKVAN